MKNLLTIISLVFASLLLGCSEDSTHSSSVLIPLAVGNEWVYKTIDYHNRYRESDTLYFDTVKILRSAFILGDSIYYSNNYVGGANRADGYWQTRVGRDRLEIAFKYPCLKGDVFRVDTLPITTVDSLGKEISFNVLIKSSCDSTLIPIRVAAGVFLANKYEVNVEAPLAEWSQKSIYYVSPNVGIVLTYWYMWDNSFYLYRKEELISYHLN